MTVNETETDASSCPASRRRRAPPHAGLLPNFNTQFNSNASLGAAKEDSEQGLIQVVFKANLRLSTKANWLKVNLVPVVTGLMAVIVASVEGFAQEFAMSESDL